MKSLRYVKLRTFLKGPEDIAMERNRNPLRVQFELESPNGEFNARYLKKFREDLDLEKAIIEPYVAKISFDLWYLHSFPYELDISMIRP